MQKRQEVLSFPREKQNKWNTRKLFMLGGLMLICFLLLVLLFYYLQYNYLSQELEAYNQRLEQVVEENKELQEEISRLQDDDYIEFLARRHLGLKKPE